MNPQSASRAEGQRIRVWDAPVRVFHWLMVVSFAGAWLTAESERWRLLHVTLGYTMAGLVLFRLVWGLVGSRTARFSSFVRGPAAVKRYLASLLQGRPEHHSGHNPAGALAIVAMLALTLAVAGSGWALYNDIGAELFEEVHEALASTMLALVALHIAAVLASSWLHGENLVAAMVSGFKRGAPQDAITRNRAGLAVLIVLAVLGFAYAQWQAAPDGAATAAVTERRHHGADDD